MQSCKWIRIIPLLYFFHRNFFGTVFYVSSQALFCSRSQSTQISLICSPFPPSFHLILLSSCSIPNKLQKDKTHQIRCIISVCHNLPVRTPPLPLNTKERKKEHRNKTHQTRNKYIYRHERTTFSKPGCERGRDRGWERQWERGWEKTK
mmetsp:Transcript_10709/g.11663  ORF Transcript_10709/g.11663 Transcript_10709/m.11663 type:complete len:149 (+) Transcript_10709:867-1313(+)